VQAAAEILAAAQDADWGPIRHDGKLHDRASYRYYWELLQRAQATGAALPDEALARFFRAR
jgi:citrate lyase subunit beta/citryl-CoA lyase